MADKAALFGINEYKNVSPLFGCVNDVEDMKALLTGVLDFKATNVRTFVNAEATKAEVLRQLRWLFRDATAGDRVVFHLSSHGSNVADKDGDEPDGRDEIFCMHDMDFDDPGSYLLDDELREWTTTLPEGVRLVVVLDTCHSGTGTRMLLSPDAVDKPPTLVDDVASLKRGFAAHGSGSRGIDAVASAMGAGGAGIVRARYVPPPAEVLAEIEAARARVAKSRKRGFVKAPLNHVLLAACRDDQTAADATIDGRPNGAFTHALCRALRAEGPGVSRQTLIDRVGKSLSDGWFSQVPQLEAPDAEASLFGGEAAAAGAGDETAPPSAKDAGPTVDSLALLDRIVGDGKGLDPAGRTAALEVLARLVPAAPMIGRGLPTRVLVPVHGICRHVAGYSDEWWRALRPFTTVYGAGTLGDARREVLWSDLVNQRSLAGGDREIDRDRAAFAAAVRGVLEDRTIDDAPGDREAFDGDGTRALSLPGFNCIDDFSVYMFDDSVRAEVIARFVEVVRPLLEGGVAIDVLSHSWGTVVAYEGLRELEARFTTPLVRNFFTLGSALSMLAVRKRLRAANQDGRKPRNTRWWVNLDARGDPVGGALKGRPFQVDEEHLGLSNMGCGFLNAKCAHGSYFKEGNVAVNRDVLARNINAG